MVSRVRRISATGSVALSGAAYPGKSGTPALTLPRISSMTTARAFRGLPLPGRGDPVGRALVPAVPDQLPRPQSHARQQGRRGGSHGHVPLGSALRPGAGETDAPPPASLVAGRVTSILFGL